MRAQVGSRGLIEHTGRIIPSVIWALSEISLQGDEVLTATAYEFIKS